MVKAGASEKKPDSSRNKIKLTAIRGVGVKRAELLIQKGYDSPARIASASPSDLSAALKCSEKQASELIANAESLVSDSPSQTEQGIFAHLAESKATKIQDDEKNTNQQIKPEKTALLTDAVSDDTSPTKEADQTNGLPSAKKVQQPDLVRRPSEFMSQLETSDSSTTILLNLVIIILMACILLMIFKG
ncbi:MAG: hypothetical protein CVV64_14090 [Candidatus Wallbacteria bacterium HGW-Wallbacteria-1]|jgi:hypothetical protein|uniref:Uncharacterized protein n=1 Tax=Candidatus Wallbacteria bacterium HGW-Wallbacteria-1 TaxID=2013854 RepID=A0A2N1PMG2_9BACT|nr:MAG: hypothetical protein CVV64_14090 [Candidatus Wallbacteria bacterium HGW-Wallbacteria-1]